MQEPYTLSGQKDISAEPLADIRHVSVNKDLSREERIAEFVRQIKDPYCFKCGKLRPGRRYTGRMFAGRLTVNFFELGAAFSRGERYNILGKRN